MSCSSASLSTTIPPHFLPASPFQTPCLGSALLFHTQVTRKQQVTHPLHHDHSSPSRSPNTSLPSPPRPPSFHLPTPLPAQVTRKQSMVAAAASLPSSITDVAPGACLPAYVAGVTPKAVLVRLLGRVQGRAGLPALADTFVSDATRLFVPGQSVQVREGGGGGGWGR